MTTADLQLPLEVIAARIAADLRTVDGSWVVDVVPEPHTNWALLRSSAVEHGHAVPPLLPGVISVRLNGAEQMHLVFLTGKLPFSRQLAHGIDQLQDAVIEETTEEWPPCPEHRHALMPVPAGELVGWWCSASDRVLVPLGRLSELSESTATRLPPPVVG